MFGGVVVFDFLLSGVVGGDVAIVEVLGDSDFERERWMVTLDGGLELTVDLPPVPDFEEEPWNDMTAVVGAAAVDDKAVAPGSGAATKGSTCESERSLNERGVPGALCCEALDCAVEALL